MELSDRGALLIDLFGIRSIIWSIVLRIRTHSAKAVTALSEHPDIEQSSSTTTNPVLGFPSKSASTTGPKTVISPERRVVGSSDVVPLLPVSSVWKRLFPAEPEIGSDTSLETVDGLELGHFIIRERIGTGGMGSVFRADDKRLQRTIALKVLAPAQAQIEGAIQRFHNESRSAARLDHDNIARVHYSGEDQGFHFIAYEYVTGQNIRDMIRERGRLSPVEAVNYSLQIATALKHTAAAGVVHRDIKPSNIILTPNGRAKLVDLGLARKQTSEESRDLTTAGTTLGTFDYIAPEQAKDPREVDVRSDIYSLGCTLYHMLTGEPPYPEGTVLQKLLDHQAKMAPDPAEKNRQVSRELSAIVQKMMDSDLDQRYANADELIQDLSTVAAAMGLRAVHPDGLIWATPTLKKKPFWEANLGLFVGIAVLLMIVFLLDLWQGQREADLIADNSRMQNSPSIPEADHEKFTPIRANGPDDQTTVAAVDVESDVSGKPIDGDLSIEESNEFDQALKDEGPSEVFPPKGILTTSFLNQFRNFRKLLGTPSVPIEESKNESDAVSDSPSAESQIAATSKPSVERDNVEPEASKVEDPSQEDRANTEEVSGNSDPNPFPMPSEDPPEISIVATDGEETKSFPTLEGAIAAAVDGSIVELRYNGVRREREAPLNVKNKTITIRAASGYRPTITFQTKNVPAQGFQTRMITISGGSVELNNLDLRMTTEDEVSTDLWSMFSIQGQGKLRLEGVNVTIENQSEQSAAVIELVSDFSGTATMDMMDKGQAGSEPKFDVEISKSFIRGGCSLFLSRHTQPTRLEIAQSVVAVNDSLLVVEGDLNTPADNTNLELQLVHSTCLLGNHVLQFTSGVEPRTLIPVHVEARNNIFVIQNLSSLIEMTGNTDVEDFQRLLRWNGRNNFYDLIETFWSIDPVLTTSSRQFDFEHWSSFLETVTSVGADNGGVGWMKDPFKKEYWEMTSVDVELDRKLTDNSAVEGAADGSDAGVDHTMLTPFEIEERESNVSGNSR